MSEPLADAAASTAPAAPNAALPPSNPARTVGLAEVALLASVFVVAACGLVCMTVPTS